MGLAADYFIYFFSGRHFCLSKMIQVTGTSLLNIQFITSILIGGSVVRLKSSAT